MSTQRHSWDLSEIPANMRIYFEEFETICGKPWERVVEKIVPAPLDGLPARGGQPHSHNVKTTGEGWYHLPNTKGRTLGWQPGCLCGHDPIPCLVLDPFVGSGTTVMVALRLGRRAMGIDLSEAYCEMARERIIRDNPIFNMPGEAKE